VTAIACGLDIDSSGRLPTTGTRRATLPAGHDKNISKSRLSIGYQLRCATSTRFSMTRL